MFSFSVRAVWLVWCCVGIRQSSVSGHPTIPWDQEGGLYHYESEGFGLSDSKKLKSQGVLSTDDIWGADTYRSHDNSNSYYDLHYTV